MYNNKHAQETYSTVAIKLNKINGRMVTIAL